MIALISVFFLKLDYKIIHFLSYHLKDILWTEEDYGKFLRNKYK